MPELFEKQPGLSYLAEIFTEKPRERTKFNRAPGLRNRGNVFGAREAESPAGCGVFREKSSRRHAKREQRNLQQNENT
jgi:hypothetical protein